MPASPQVTETKTTVPAAATKPVTTPPAAAKPETKPETTETKTETTEQKKERKRVDLSVVTLDMAEADADSFDNDETVTVLSNRERTETQLAIDAKVKNAYQAWIYGGKPETMKASLAAKLTAEQKTELGVKGVVQRFFVTPENVDAYQTLLDNAGRFLGYQVKRYPVQKDDRTGRDMLPFIVRDKREYTPRAKKGERTTATPGSSAATATK